MERGDGYDQVLSLWSIQESLLQAYRSIFITAESIVFGIAAAISTLNPPSAIVLTLLGFFLLWMWHRVCSNRAEDVSFVQWLLARAEEGNSVPAPLGSLKQFQDGAIITIGTRSVWRHKEKDPDGNFIDEPFVNMLKSPTRRWMEVYLPLFFAGLWVVVTYLAIKALQGAI